MVISTHVFKDVLNSTKLKQFRQISRLKESLKSTITITDPLLSFSPLEYPVSKDGYFQYLEPRHLTAGEEITFLRRLWAGGNMKLMSSLKYDKPYTCIETLKRVRKTSQGVYVTLQRDLFDEENNNLSTSLLQELRTLVYTNLKPQVSLSRNSVQILSGENSYLLGSFTFDKMDVIKYNILSSNPHKIHWDSQYCIVVEGYKDIIVPGPYIVQLTTSLIEQYYDKHLTSIKYRNVNYIYPGTKVNIFGDQNGKTFWMSDAKEPSLIYFILNII